MNCNFELIRLYNAPMTLSAIIFQIYEFQVMKRTTFIDVRSNYVHIIVNLWDSDELCILGDLYIRGLPMEFMLIKSHLERLIAIAQAQKQGCWV